MLKGQISTGKMFQKLIYIKNRHSALQYKLAQRRTQGGTLGSSPPWNSKNLRGFQALTVAKPPPLGP